jgi:hypothetical protein
LKIKSLTCISGDGLGYQEVNEAHIRNMNVLDKILEHVSRTRSSYDCRLPTGEKSFTRNLNFCHFTQNLNFLSFPRRRETIINRFPKI